jgi:endoglucanase
MQKHPLVVFAMWACPAVALASGYFHTSGNQILDDEGRPATLNGISWFGLETKDRVPHGLWQRSLDSYLDQLKGLGYNLLRIPWSDDIFKPLAPGRKLNINYSENPELKELTPLQVLDKLVEKAGQRGIRILLDRHRPDENAQSELWYTATVSETTWIEHWKALAVRYRTNATVIGADLHNEPHGKATWGSGDEKTDWRLAAERAGNAVLSIQSNWLIVVEGVGRVGNDSYWWGGNLLGVASHPVRLKVPQRVVYSPHDYGPGVSGQQWFNDADFPKNLVAVWDKHWGYIHRQGLAPVLVGEFGGRAVDASAETDPMRKKEAVWQNALVDYIRDNRMYWTYWCWNPNSGDTGGVLKDDWATVNQPKQNMLNRLIRKGVSPAN